MYIFNILCIYIDVYMYNYIKYNTYMFIILNMIILNTIDTYMYHYIKYINININTTLYYIALLI